MKKIFACGLFSAVLVACGESYFAKVNGTKITADDFDAYTQYKRIAIRNDEQKEKALDQYLQRSALANLIEKKILKDQVVMAEIDEMKKEVLISRYFDRFLKEQITDQAISNYYNANISDYEETKVHVSHILLRLNKNMDDTQRGVKLTTAQEAYSKIQAGMDFEEAVNKYSEDAVSVKKSGDLGWLKKNAISKSFSDKAFSLAAGKVSEPFETPFGFHIIKVLDEPKTSRKSFESVKGSIRYHLRNQAKDAERKRLLGMVKIEKAS